MGSPSTIGDLRSAVLRVLSARGDYGVARVTLEPDGFGAMRVTIRPLDPAAARWSWLDAGGLGRGEVEACANAWASFLLVVAAAHDRAATAAREATEEQQRAHAALVAAREVSCG